MYALFLEHGKTLGTDGSRDCPNTDAAWIPGCNSQSKTSGIHNSLLLKPGINTGLMFCISNFVFCVIDYMQWLPSPLHRGFPRAGDEVQQLWLLQHCAVRRPRVAAADAAGCRDWSRTRAAEAAPFSYATLKQRATVLLAQIKMVTWPVNWSQNILDGNDTREPVQNQCMFISFWRVSLKKSV